MGELCEIFPLQVTLTFAIDLTTECINFGSCRNHYFASFLDHHRLAPVSRSWAKHRLWYFQFPDISRQFLLKENCPNSRTSDDIDMKLGAVTKLDKRSKTTSKTFGQFFLFMDNLNRSRRQIPDV